MIRNISIENFKSILRDDIALKDLTVIIGANGAGKSNLIKSLEFLAAIPEIGLVGAVNRFGGYEGLVPKTIPGNAVIKTRVKFKYTAELPPASTEPVNNPPITVDHDFQFGYSHKHALHVIEERLSFNQILSAIELLEKDSLAKLNVETSSFELRKGPGLVVKYRESPPFSSENLNHYLEWLGLPFQNAGIRSATRLHKFLRIVEHSLRESNKVSQTLIDPQFSSLADYSILARTFMGLLKSTRRYDLLLNELRKEQQVSESSSLSSSGTNMPSVLRYMLSMSGEDTALSRILSTIGEVSPHVLSMNSAKVRTGKEFVEFRESSAKRSVESWESSDGTLRTLAILIALETQPEYSTIIIEEPEQNLHPWAIRGIIDHIRRVIKSRNLQVIVTTHSQQVLEATHPNEVLVATRSKEEGTKFKKLSDIVPQANIEIGEVGRMWVKGLLGGVPAVD